MSLPLEQASSGSFALAKAGLAIGSTVQQISTANTVNYTIDGVYQTAKVAVATIAPVAPAGSPVLPLTIAIGFKQAYGVWLDTAGVLTVTFGPASPFTSATDKVGPPTNPGGRCCIGVFTIAAVTVLFTLGTTALNAAGITTTYTDVMDLPGSAIA